MKSVIYYHGSQNVVQHPTLRKGKPNNDYGKGFYCTKDIDAAYEWACKENTDGFVNKYNLVFDGLKILDLTKTEYSVLNWIAILLKNRTFELNKTIAIEARDYIIRNFMPETKGCDLIVGYRADDSYFQFAEDFITNTQPIRVLNKALYLGKLGIQTVLVSKKAFSQIEFIGTEFAEREIYYNKFAERDRNARITYNRIAKSEYFVQSDIYVMDIIRQEMKNDDPRLQRIVPA